MAISNLLQPNPTVPGLLSSLAPKKTVPTLTAGPQSLLPTTGVAPAKNYSNFTDADWLAYQSSKPKPTTTTPVASNSGAGSYKGVPLSGTDAQIAEQMRKIDNPTPTIATPTTPVATQTTPPVTTPPAGSTPQTTPPVRGLFADVLSSIRATGSQTEADQRATAAKIADLRTNLQDSLGGIASQPQTLNYGLGRQGQLVNQAAAKESALQGELQSQIAAGSQKIGALSSVAGFASPRSADLLVDPTTGQPIGDINNMGSALANWASIRAGANTAGNFTADYQTGLANLRAADSIGQQIKNTIASNPTINSQPLSAWTNIKQLLSAQFSDPAQQLLAQQVNQYIQTLGLDENTVMNIASQQQGTLGQLLDSLREQSAAQVESKNPKNVINNPQGTNTFSSGGQVINTAVGPIDNAWFN